MNKKLQQLLKNISIKSPSLREGFRMGLILFLSLGMYTPSFSQGGHSQYINYQGVASNATGELMSNENITVMIALRLFAPDAITEYEENHSVTTDKNAVFSLKIGNGTVLKGDYFSLERGLETYITVSINGIEIGTTEMMAVPYALSAGNNYWYKDGDDIINSNRGLVQINSNLEVGGNIQLQFGSAANEISTDGTLASNSDKAIPTEKAIKTYIDNNSGGVTKIDDLSDAKSDNQGLGNGSSLFLGLAAGANDDGTDNKNVAVGLQALHKNITGSENTAFGYVSLQANTEGNRNSAIGYGVLNKNISGSDNTANGHTALLENTIGSHNTAIGVKALLFNKVGNRNTATGSEALYKNKGSSNTANGYRSLYNNTTGNDNTANGIQALFNNTKGNDNTANGILALFNNTEGNNNTAIGTSSLFNIKTGNFNTAIGRQALQNTTASYNVAVGNDALNDLTTGSNNIGVGADAQVPNATASHQVRIGNNQIIYAGIQVAWTVTSDAAWKDDIQPLAYGLNMVNQLKPVDYVRKNNETNTREIGFIAQDVELLLNKLGYTNNGMLTTDDEGHLSLRYNDFIPVLTKAVQELNDKTTVLEKMNNELLQRIEALENK